MNPVEVVSERRATILTPRGGFGAELSSHAGFFGSRSDFVWISVFGLSLGFFSARFSLPQGGFGAFLRAARRVRRNSIESGRGSFGAKGDDSGATGRVRRQTLLQRKFFLVLVELCKSDTFEIRIFE